MKWLIQINQIVRNALVKLLENILSKKFLVFITSTCLLAVGLLPPEAWVAITLAVLGAVSAIDYKHGSKSLQEPDKYEKENEIELEEPLDIP